MDSNGNNSPFASSDDKWVLLNAMFTKLGLVRQHLDSFNSFLTKGLDLVIEEESEIKSEDSPNVYVKLEKIEIKQPEVREANGANTEIWPMEARLRNLTYAAPLYLYMVPEIHRTNFPELRSVQKQKKKHFIGYLPIMLNSEKCRLNSISNAQKRQKGEDPLDEGGYFIINGSERVLVTQEDLAPNKILVEKFKFKKTMTKTSQAKVFSVLKGFRAPVTLERSKDGNLKASFPSVSRKISLTILLRALGMEKDGEITRRITSHPKVTEKLLPILRAEEIRKREEALNYIGKRVAVGQTEEYRTTRTNQVLDKYLLPHLGNEEKDRIKKAHFLCQMAQKVLELESGLRDPDDKDHYANKRLNLAGDLLLILFRNAFRTLIRDIRYQLERRLSSNKNISSLLSNAVRADVISERLRHALATGNWVGGKAGVSQLLDRTNYMSALSHLRRVVSPLGRSQPHFEARDLHPTHWGKICPSETPEGPNCGLVKNLALQAYISTEINLDHVKNSLKENGVKIDNYEVKNHESRVYLNGTFIGVHPEGQKLVKNLRKERRNRVLDEAVNITYYEKTNDVLINGDKGRVRRPLLIVKDGKSLLAKEHIEKVKTNEMLWEDLTRRGLIEYLDTEEEENSLIALFFEDLTEKHTHLEISPAAILGICASLIPFPEHNRSDRNVYESGMAKQSLGIYAANYRLRMDTRAHLLHYPQKPLVKTHGMDAIKFNKRPAGQNFIIAVLSYRGYNMEDSIIINRASIERGLGRSSSLRAYLSEERQYPGGQEDVFTVPNPEVRGYKDTIQYKHLADDGIVEPESQIDGRKGEVIIGRTSPPRFLEERTDINLPTEHRRETSTSMRFGESGTVDSVIFSENTDGHRLVKVRMRSLRVPEIGDKFASRHGQKGILGNLENPADLPFNELGMSPDIIINPHAIPSRMTIGQLIEILGGKLAAASGDFVTATAFESKSVDQLMKELNEAGYQHYGKEALYDGRTGEKFQVEIFLGIAFYQKLHHLVNDKIHARARGPVQILTRQPTEGRSREGGLKFGEMERDCLIGHGTSLILKERLLDESDKTEVLFCEECGFLAQFDQKLNKNHCPLCRDEVNVSKIEVSYAFKLLWQELMSMGITPRIKLKERT